MNPSGLDGTESTEECDEHIHLLMQEVAGGIHLRKAYQDLRNQFTIHTVNVQQQCSEYQREVEEKEMVKNQQIQALQSMLDVAKAQLTDTKVTERLAAADAELKLLKERSRVMEEELHTLRQYRESRTRIDNERCVRVMELERQCKEKDHKCEEWAANVESLEKACEELRQSEDSWRMGLADKDRQFAAVEARCADQAQQFALEKRAWQAELQRLEHELADCRESLHARPREDCPPPQRKDILPLQCTSVLVCDVPRIPVDCISLTAHTECVTSLKDECARGRREAERAAQKCRQLEEALAEGEKETTAHKIKLLELHSTVQFLKGELASACDERASLEREVAEGRRSAAAAREQLDHADNTVLALAKARGLYENSEAEVIRLRVEADSQASELERCKKALLKLALSAKRHQSVRKHHAPPAVWE